MTTAMLSLTLDVEDDFCRGSPGEPSLVDLAIMTSPRACGRHPRTSAGDSDRTAGRFHQRRANVVQYTDWGGNNQQWQLIRIG
ncbi:hypothetical protein ACWENR_11025 [Micromonospora sp. NPDC004336]